MAINLSRSFARPCEMLCELTVDDVAIPQLTVERNGEYLVARFGQQTPTIKYNGEGYTCESIVIKAPSMHTIEDIRADAEVVAVCHNPAGAYVCMSTLVRTSTGASRSKSFLNAFVPYVNTERPNDVNLGNEWSLTQLIPPEPAYYTYRGGLPWGGPTVQWVVFRSMGNIDPTDFAVLTKAIGSTPIELVNRTQEVFFSDIAHIAGVPDGKAYMRCKRVKRKGEEPVARITPVQGLQEDAKRKEEESQGSTFGGIQAWVAEMGMGNLLEAAIYALALLVGVWAAYQLSTSDRGLTLARPAQNAAASIRGLFSRPAQSLS